MHGTFAANRPASVAIVGNAATKGWAAQIDASDWVVRFNNAPGFGTATGRRVTHLALVNHGGQMAEWLGDPNFTRRPVVSEAGAFILPFARKETQSANADGRCWTDAAMTRLSHLKRPVTILPEAVRAQAQEIVRGDGASTPAPSTGLLATLHMLRTLGTSTCLDIYGFGFSGWSGHAFDRERAFFEQMRLDGRLRLQPLQRPRHA